MKVLLHILPLLFFLSLHHLPANGSSISTDENYQITIQIPEDYSPGFVGRAFLLESNGSVLPHFRVALSVETSFYSKYACSLDVFIGDVKIWSSGHFSPFFASDRCFLELTDGGDLRLKQGAIANGSVGWRTGTSGQGVQRLELLSSGNLVLLDARRNIKWQSFDFPTNVMLLGQRLNVATRLTTPFPRISSTSYSFEIQSGKLALYLNSNKSKYSYWEYKPPPDIDISLIQLSDEGLQLFDQNFQMFAQVWSSNESVRYLSLSYKTGNLGMYHYSATSGKFEASVEVLNSTCQLPLACKSYGVCTLENSCSCIRLLSVPSHLDNNSDCGYGIEDTEGKFCDVQRYEMLELEGVESIFSYEPTRVDLSKEDCTNLCMCDCKCQAVLHNAGKCFVYEMVRGIRQIGKWNGVSYFIKIRKGERGGQGKVLGLKKWALVLIGVVDGLVFAAVIGGFGYYIIQKRRKNLTSTDNGT